MFVSERGFATTRVLHCDDACLRQCVLQKCVFAKIFHILRYFAKKNVWPNHWPCCLGAYSSLTGFVDGLFFVDGFVGGIFGGAKAGAAAEVNARRRR